MPITPRSHAWYGCRRDARDKNDRMMALAPIYQRDVVDLRQWLPPVMYQDAIGSCTAHGVTVAARWHINRRNTTYDFPMSRLQLYWDSRNYENTAESDSGAEIRDVIKVLSESGVGHEDLWPYDISKFTMHPPQEVYDDAVQYKALSYTRVPVSVNGLKQAISLNHPVIIGISVYDSFESAEVEQTGVVPMPGASEEMVGGHCMLAVGYGQKPGYFTVRNSWGGAWGDKGDCYIPEAYLGSTSLGSDYWIINLFGSAAEQTATAA